MDGVTPTTLTCLDLTISIPGSSPVRDWNMKPLRLSKRPEPEDNWINIGYLNSSEETEDNDTDSPDAAHRRDGSDHIPPRKKLRLSSEQSRLLEESFRQNHTLNPKQKEDLGELLKLKPRQVEVWFQNRRARSKMKQTEMECEYLKRWFGSLTERNRKLQKEVEELRAMKVGPVNPLSAHNYEPTIVSSVTMCPRCERVSSSSAHVERPMYGPTSTASVSDKEAVVQQCRQPSAAF